MSPPVLMVFAYLVIGLATTITAWAQMPDEIDMAIGFDLDDESNRPLMRSLVTLVFVISWPVLLPDVIRRR